MACLGGGIGNSGKALPKGHFDKATGIFIVALIIHFVWFPVDGLGRLEEVVGAAGAF